MNEPTAIRLIEPSSTDEFWSALKNQLSNIDRTIEHGQMFLKLGSAEPRLGDHLVTPRYGNIYTHHGVYIGDYKVIHYAGASGTGQDQSVQEVSLDTFSGGPSGPGFIVAYHHDYPFTTEEVAERAKSRVGEDKYNLLFNNCEHFANWCINDKAESRQVGTFDILNNGNRLRYQSFVTIGRFAGRGACALVAGLLNAGEKIIEAEKSAEAARVRSDHKLKAAEEKWLESEHVRAEVRRQVRAMLEQHFGELHAITDDMEERLFGDDNIDELHQSIDAFLNKIGSEKRNDDFSQFKERFGFK